MTGFGTTGVGTTGFGTTGGFGGISAAPASAAGAFGFQTSPAGDLLTSSMQPKSGLTSAADRNHTKKKAGLRGGGGGKH